MRSRTARRRSARNGRPESAWSLTRFLLLLAVLAWGLRSLVVQPFSIPSGSMLPALYIGDYVVVAKWPYGYSRFSFPLQFPAFDGRILGRLPSRGDVVVFHHPARNEDLVKRVIGLPGDTVEIANGKLMLNGRTVVRRKAPPFAMPVSVNSPCKVVPPAIPTTLVREGRPFCIYPAFIETLPGGRSYTVLDQVPGGPADNFGPVRVPPHHLFLLGDNRDDSLDSRFPRSEGGIAMLPTSQLIGRALVTVWSTDGSASYFNPLTWFSSLRKSRLGNGYEGEAE